jgi:hypothetical protein
MLESWNCQELKDVKNWFNISKSAFMKYNALNTAEDFIRTAPMHFLATHYHQSVKMHVIEEFHSNSLAWAPANGSLHGNIV